MECRKKLSETTEFKRVSIIEEDDDDESESEEESGEFDADSHVRQILQATAFFKDEGTELY